MNILFITLVKIKSIEERGIYQDLLRRFRDEGHDVTIVTAMERRNKVPTNFLKTNGVSILQVKTLNITKTNVVEKGLGTLAIEYQYLRAIKKHLKNKRFDLVLYSTPPITFVKVINYIKKRDGATSYLLLKDIFPQNAVDMGMIEKDSFLHKRFVAKEKKLYAVSDYIGCMSPANANFLLKNNPEINPMVVEINPNSIEPVQLNYSKEEKDEIRLKYGVPTYKTVFVYGGNLGKPQGLDFLLETISGNHNRNAFFLVVGDGTEFPRMQEWFATHQPNNAMLIRRLPKEDYDKLLATCDVGMIFLDKNFLIPNFPSRLLSYLEMRMPVLAATDPNSDVGDMVEAAGCGYKVISGDLETMNQRIDDLMYRISGDAIGNNAWNLLQKEYLVEKSYELIMDKMRG